MAQSVLYNVITYFILLLLPLLCSSPAHPRGYKFTGYSNFISNTQPYSSTRPFLIAFSNNLNCASRDTGWVGSRKEGGREGRENFSSPSLFSSDLATDNGVSRKNVLWAATLIRWPLLNVSDNSLACDFGHFNMAAEWNALYVIKPWSFVSIERII